MERDEDEYDGGSERDVREGGQLCAHAISAMQPALPKPRTEQGLRWRES